MRFARNLRCILFGLLLAATPLCAQQYSFHAYQQDVGLENLTIEDIALDTHGFFWVGTQNGLYRFLGSSFQRIGPEQGMPDIQINDILVTPDGIVWVGTPRNLYRWNGDTFQPAAARPVPILNAHRMAYESSGQLLIATDSRLNRLTYKARADTRASQVVKDNQPVSLQPVFSDTFLAANPSLRRVGSLTIAPDGTLWMSCTQHLCAWHNGTLTEWATAQGVPIEWYNSLQVDTHGSLWAVSNQHVLELPRNAARFLDRTPPGPDVHRLFSRNPLAVDRQGRVLVASTDGMARWDGTLWSLIGERNGLASSHISALFVDPLGDLWMGSTGHGIHHWVGYSDWEGWSTHQGLPANNVWALGGFSPDAAQTYIGTEKGPAVIDLSHAEITPLFKSPAWTYGQVGGMARDRSGLFWVATQSGALLTVQPDTLRVTKVADVGVYISDLTLDADGLPLVLTYTDIYRLDKSLTVPTLRAVPESRSLLGGDPKFSRLCKVADDTIWFATSKGMLLFHQGHWTHPTVVNPLLPPTNFQSISPFSHDGSLWVIAADPSGHSDALEVWHLVPNAGRLDATKLPIPAQYHGLSLYGVLADAQGWVWLGTDDGLLAWNGSSWRHLTQESGLIWNDTNGNQIENAPDGSIWIGTSGGLGHLLHPEHIFDPVPLQLSIVSMQRGQKSVRLSDRSPLPWSRSDLSFEYAAPSDVNRSELTFRYRIPQLQTAWVETRDTTAHFATLQPGSYTFEVMALNPARDAQSPVLSVNFTVLPPWWRTDWFYALSVLAFSLLLVMVYRLRTRRLVLQKLRLEATVLERTRELEASREALRIQATVDGLTGLLNRSSVLALLDDEMDRSRREDKTLTLVLVDLDHFKQINDLRGHLAGDAALACFARTLSSAIRGYDHAGRYGGEEFLVVLPGLELSEISARLQALHTAITGLTCHYAGEAFVFTCSIGAVSLRMASRPIDRNLALATADQALYKAKHSGRNRLIHHSLID